jgi:predicted aspartyl protease
MISGRVNTRLEAGLPLEIEDSTGHLHSIEPIIDTAFNGDLSLRMAQISLLGLSWVGSLPCRLADGSVQTNDVYDAILWWDGNPLTIRVRPMETTPLLGTRLLGGHEVNIRLVPGGVVTVTLIP